MPDFDSVILNPHHIRVNNTITNTSKNNMAERTELNLNKELHFTVKLLNNLNFGNEISD